MGRRLSDSSSSPGTSGVWLEQGAEQRMCHRRHCITEPHSFTPDSIHIHAPGLHLLPDVASVACTPQSEIKACSLKGWNAFCRWLFCCDIWGVRKRKVFFTWQTQSFKGVFLHWVMNRSVNCKDLAFQSCCVILHFFDVKCFLLFQLKAQVFLFPWFALSRTQSCLPGF